MKHLLLMLFITALAFEAKSQGFLGLPPRTGPDLDRGMSLYLVIPSLMISPHSQINPLLVENGYPFIPRPSFNYGLGLSYRIKRFEPGIDFSVGNQHVTNPYLNSELLRRPLNASIYLNYHLLRKDSFTLFPFIGYSITDTNLILSRQSATDDFTGLLQQPNTTVNLQHLSDGLLVGMGVALGQHWEESTATFRLKFAYRLPSGSYPWESRFSSFNNSPLDSFPYFFIQFEMGVLANWKKGDPWMDKF